MLLAALLTTLVSEPAATPIGRQARAMVTIVRIEPIALGQKPNAEAVLRDARVRDRDGQSQPAKLIEFF